MKITTDTTPMKLPIAFISLVNNTITNLPEMCHQWIAIDSWHKKKQQQEQEKWNEDGAKTNTRIWEEVKKNGVTNLSSFQQDEINCNMSVALQCLDQLGVKKNSSQVPTMLSWNQMVMEALS